MTQDNLKEIVRNKLLNSLSNSNSPYSDLKIKEMLFRLENPDFVKKLNKYKSLITKGDLTLKSIEQNILGDLNNEKSTLLFQEENADNAKAFYEALKGKYSKKQIAALMALSHQETAKGGNKYVKGNVWDPNKIQEGEQGGIVNRGLYSFEEGVGDFSNTPSNEKPTSYWYQDWLKDEGKNYKNPILAQTDFYVNKYLTRIEDKKKYKEIFDNPNSSVAEITKALHDAQSSKSSNAELIQNKAEFLYNIFPTDTELELQNKGWNMPQTNIYKDGGGLSRSKDYGSSKKPYPKVKSSDFAGKHRSYPIPTKADARDALRLAGLHGRSDIKAKVYKKYPSLKHANGGELLGLDYYTNQLYDGGPLESPMVARSIINPNLTVQAPETLTQQAVNPIIPKQGVSLGSIDPVSTVSNISTLFSSPKITSQGENQQADVDEENNFDPTYIDVSKVKKDFDTKQAIGSSVGAGVGLGATVGSIVPGIGTVVGGAVGAVGGAIAGGIKSIFGKKKAKRKEKRAKNKARGLNTMATLESYMGKAYGFADGGNINNLMGRKYFAEGGLTSFNTGGSHEESPIGGIPQGIGDNGNVNLVEEGETRYQDYIFSDRLTLDEDIVKELNLPSNLIGKTFAEASEILAKDIEEHPNDPISKRGFEEMMVRLQAANNMKKDLEDSNTFAEGGSLNGEPMEPSPTIKEVEGESENLGNELKEVTDEQVKRITASNIKEEKIKGGRASEEVRENATELFDPLEISVGIKVEMEHTDSIEAAREIALDHLTENKDYYTRLYHIGLIDEPITEEEENFLKEKWTRIEDVEALDEEQGIVDIPEEENVSNELEQPLNQEIPIEPQQFAKGGDLFGPNRNGAYFRNGRWYLNSDPRLSNKTNIRMDNPNRGNYWKTDPIYPIPPERQLFKVPDIKGGWNGILPDNTKPYGDTFNPPFIKGGEDEKTTVEPIKTNTSTTKKTSIPSIDTEEEFDRMMDRKYNFGDLTGLTGPRFDPYQLEADLEGNRIANENETSFNPISDFELTPEQLSTLSPEDYQAYKRHERAMKLQGLGSLLQYAPVLGNLIGAATVGKAEKVNPTYITPEQLNDYLQYNPIDPNTYTNPILNQASNARRSFADASGGSRAAILAANLGLNAQTQKAISDAALQAEAVNEQRRVQAKEFNRGTNQFNASERARAKQYNASSKTMTDDINARNRAARRTAIRNYLSGAMQGLGSIGREKAYRNTIKTMGMDYYLDALGQVKYKKS
ncbi:DUF5661 family protein [uncultured Fusobacterium sp.]|uniref:DUF5661 family protein n=1 Tax=uncultured Fusobacterium sp. TaxID=159267 RepID=UPI0025F0F2EA|nr:DUF5661 family protein [uncultured Fusobacterium sp.]